MSPRAGGVYNFHFFLAILNKQLKELIIAWSYNGGGGGGGGGHVHFCPVVIETKKDLTGQRRRLVDISGHLWICVTTVNVPCVTVSVFQPTLPCTILDSRFLLSPSVMQSREAGLAFATGVQSYLSRTTRNENFLSQQFSNFSWQLL